MVILMLFDMLICIKETSYWLKLILNAFWSRIQQTANERVHKINHLMYFILETHSTNSLSSVALYVISPADTIHQLRSRRKIAIKRILPDVHSWYFSLRFASLSKSFCLFLIFKSCCWNVFLTSWYKAA